MANQRFDDQSIRRIVRSVLWTEHAQRNTAKWPRYYSRRGIGQGADGASGTFIAILSGDAGAADWQSPGTGTGTDVGASPLMGMAFADIYSISCGGDLTYLGNYTIWNPFPYELAAECPAGPLIHMCAKTCDADAGTGTGTGTGTDNEDEFTITGPDILGMLLAMQDAGDKKALSLIGAADYQSFKWTGRTCVTGTGT